MLMRELLFKILKSVLWGENYDGQLSAKEFHGVLSLAEEQTVFGLVMNAMNDVKIADMEDKMPLFEAIGVMELIKQQNKIVNIELADFASLCEKNGLGYIVFKGQTIGCMYPKPELRMSGDIDFVSNVTQKTQIAQILGVEIPEMVEYEVAFDRNGIRYELHTSLREWAKKRHQKVCDKLLESEFQKACYVAIEGQKVRTLSPTMYAAYVFIHIFFHFIREGVSLRQLCDWAMVLHHYKDEIDRDELMQMLNGLDIYEAYCAFGTILVDKLELPLSEFPVPINDVDRKWQEKILEDIFRGGNFGKLNHQANTSWKYKAETFGVALRNSFKYYRLCPSEVGGMIPRLVKGNLKVLLKR